MIMVLRDSFGSQPDFFGAPTSASTSSSTSSGYGFFGFDAMTLSWIADGK
jgi:hypothetical protein